MSNYYFGFFPSDTLDKQIDEVYDLMDNRPDEAFFPQQEKVCNRIAHEIIEELFVKLVSMLEPSKRKDKMNKLIDNINSAIDTMLKHIITEQPNDKVIDSFNFLRNETVFEDNNGNRHIGYALSETDGQKVFNAFEQAKISDKPNDLLITAMHIIIRNNVDHFVGKFGKTLHLGLIKRKAIPIADTAITKACLIAVDKMLPELDKQACIKLADHFEKMLIIRD